MHVWVGADEGFSTGAIERAVERAFRPELEATLPLSAQIRGSAKQMSAQLTRLADQAGHA